MKNIFKSIRSKAQNTVSAVRSFFISLYCSFVSCVSGTACDCRGDLATNTIGAIIIAVVIVGLLITAINAFFPGFFTNMFNSMSTKLNNNW